MNEQQLNSLDAVFKKWEKRGTSGKYGGPRATAENGVAGQLEQGRKAWRDKFGDNLPVQPLRRSAPSRSKKRSKQKNSPFDLQVEADLKFHISPAFIPAIYKRCRPFMGKACDACCPESLNSFFNNEIPLKGMHNILNINVYTRNNLFRRNFPNACFAWTLNFSRHDYTDVKKAVRQSSRVETCIYTSGLQDSTPQSPATCLGKNIVAEKKEVKQIISDMAAAIYKRLIRFTTWCLLKVFGRMFSSIQVHCGQIEMIKEAAQEDKPIIFLPLHKSHLDYIVLTFALVSCEIKAPHVAAGDNLKNIPIFSWLLRHLGGFFIKRKLDHMSNKEELYKCVLQEYVEQLLQHQQYLEIYIEGGRSRTGKALLPKSGLLSLVISSVIEGVVPDVYIVPVNISYDKIVECEGYVRELLGQPKTPETFCQAVRSIWRVVRSSYGHVRIDFAQPFSLQEFSRSLETSTAIQQFAVNQVAKSTMNSSPRSSMVRNYSSQSLDSYDEKCFPLTKAVGYHVLYDAVNCGAIMSTNMVAFLLLNKHRQGAAYGQLASSFDWLKEEVMFHGRDVGFSGATKAVVYHAIALLGDAVLVTHAQDSKAADECGHFVQPDVTLPRLLNLVFYSNQVVSLFAVEAVLACAIVATAEEAGIQLMEAVGEDRVISQSQILRKAEDLGDILQREFIFVPPCKSPQDAWREGLEKFRNSEILQTVENTDFTMREKKWADSLAEDSAWNAEEDVGHVADISYKLTKSEEQLQSLKFLQTVLSPVLESYWLAACGLQWLKQKKFTESEFLCALQSCAKERVQGGVTLFPETCSLEPYRNALRVFKYWKVVQTKQSEELKLLSLTDKYQNEGLILELTEKINQYRL